MEEDRKNEPGRETPRVMSREDVHEYSGITLDQSGAEEKEAPRQQGGAVRIRVVSTADMPWWKKALFWGAALLIVALLFATAWVVLLGGAVLAAVAAVVVLIKKYLGRM